MSVSEDTVLITPLDEIIKDHVAFAIRFFQGDKKKAARALGISHKTIYNYAHKYGWMKPASRRRP